MLLSKEISLLATDLKGEASGRPYVEKLMPEVAAEESFWRMMIELFEIVLHRRGFVVTRRENVRVDVLRDEVQQTRTGGPTP